MSSDFENIERRCPKLGSVITFGYCEHCGENKLPCAKVFDCWWERFDVTGYLKANLPQKDFDNLAQSRPEPKINSIVELIRQAKERQAKSGQANNGQTG